MGKLRDWLNKKFKTSEEKETPEKDKTQTIPQPRIFQYKINEKAREIVISGPAPILWRFIELLAKEREMRRSYISEVKTQWTPYQKYLERNKLGANAPHFGSEINLHMHRILVMRDLPGSYFDKGAVILKYLYEIQSKTGWEEIKSTFDKVKRNF